MKSIDLNNAPFVLLDDSRSAHKAQPSLLFHSPDHIIIANNFDELGPAFDAIDSALADGFHVAGWIAYECARHFEKKLASVITEKADEPLVWMLVTRHRLQLTASDLERLLHSAEHGNSRCATLEKGPPAQSEADYLAALKAVHNYITAGDVYQINHTLPIPVSLKGSALGLYSKLRQRQPVPFGAYIDTGNHKILSLSPELFLEKKGDRLLARPMKGTAARGLTCEEDRIIQQSLKDDPKSQAENLMIVDLIRNDLSRISEAGSVKVPTLFDVEQYPTLHQMTSDVTATAHKALQPSELLAAMFPCGSITGAPKVRAMEIIGSLENTPRGVYCGTIGHFSPKTNAHAESWCLNVPIRTLIMDKENRGRLHVGSGVVADSDPSGEYKECLLKASFTDGNAKEFSLIETLQYSDGKLQSVDAHINRLVDSAYYFSFPVERKAVKAALSEHCLALTPLQEPRRVRLLLDRHGAITITSQEISVSTDEVLSVCVSARPTDSKDLFLRHKTTNRPLYNKAVIAAKKLGHADIIFFNEQGHLTEGAISNIFIEKDGTLYTPPEEAGLLSGVLRTKLLAKRKSIQIKNLTREDLVKADRLFIGNALRGLREVTLSPDIWHPDQS